ncbi:MAG: DMT family transporter [Desulfobacterales bacterium]|jgi:drug/metabolite transporter (DMT)-like permease
MTGSEDVSVDAKKIFDWIDYRIKEPNIITFIHTNRNHAVIAAFWMSGTLVSFMAMAVGGRELSEQLSTFQILFFRSLIGVLIVGFFLGCSNWRQIFTINLRVHLLRNISHFGGQFGWFYGIAFIPLAEVFALEFTVPVWTAVLATVLLKEQISRTRVAAIVFGILGVFLILRPGLAVVSPAALAVLGSAFCYALSHTLTRRLALVDTPLTILFYMTVIQLPLGFVTSIVDWTTPSLSMLPWIIVVGVAALSGHYCMARALAIADATVVVPMDFLRLPLIAAVGFLFYGESLDWLVLAGGAVMFTGNFINIQGEKKRKLKTA